MDKLKLGKLIRDKWEKIGVSQTELAKNLGMHKSLVCDWEHGRKEPTGTMLARIMNQLKISTEDLNTVENSPTTEICSKCGCLVLIEKVKEESHV